MPSLSFFLLVTQVLALHIKRNQFNVITALGVQFKLSQFAEDTAVFLKSKFEVPKIMRYIEEFTGVSGLKINIDNTVLFPLKYCSSSEIENIPVKHKLTYLGVIICKN